MCVEKACQGDPTGIVPCPATPTTFGHIRAANGQGQQRRRITSIQPPTGLQEWLRTFQSWTGPEKLLALDELIDSCEPTQVKHMMQVIEPQFQRDFISLLPKEPWRHAAVCSGLVICFVITHRTPLHPVSPRLSFLKVLKGHDDHVITCLQFCGNRIVSGSDDNTLKVWSAITGKIQSSDGAYQPLLVPYIDPFCRVVPQHSSARSVCTHN
ncbi:hypothetical protein GOODEAATRI_002381 [Goodea atripinnis]|uniref:Uncharacterized protein n=1 Tax=Goodea atripinnis TaxID=208336 RepID=A0ABV0NR86_9TELE